MESTHSKSDIFVVADDLGLTKSVNDGIIFLLKRGKINGASLMANGKAFEDAVARCLEVESPNIGAHLVLVEEESLSGMKFSKNHKTFFIKYILGLIKLPDVEKEFKDQLDKILRAGVKPVFINSHQHLHLLSGILDVAIRLAKEFNIPYIRLVNEPVSLKKGRFFRQIQLLFLNFLSWRAKSKIKKAGLKSNDYFIGFLNAGHLKQKDINVARDLLRHGKIVELGCHPGFEDNDLRKKYSHWPDYNWQEELELLKND